MSNRVETVHSTTTLRESAPTVFYSWQSDLPNSTNRTFIETALEKAAKSIRDELAIEPVIDRDTKGLSGSPNVAKAILDKIESASAFVADVSFINQPPRPNSTFLSRLREWAIRKLGERVGARRPAPNPNVLFELGYAVRCLGWDRVVLVLNTASGSLEDLPFDLRGHRIVTYQATELDNDKAERRKKLASDLRRGLESILKLPCQVEIQADSHVSALRDIEAFRCEAFRLFDSQRTTALRGMLSDLPGKVRALLDIDLATDSTEPLAEIGILLDQATLIGIGAIRSGDIAMLETFVQSLVRTFETGFNDYGSRSVRRGKLPTDTFWLHVAARFVIVGAMASSTENWNAVRTLAVASPANDIFRINGRRTGLLRQAAHIKEAETKGSRNGAFCESFETALTETVEALPWAHEHFGATLPSRNEAIARFDCLAYLIPALEWTADDFPASYPCFIHFGPMATDGLVSRLVEDTSMQTALFGRVPDPSELARFLRVAIRYAADSGNFGFLWSSRNVQEFIRRFPSSED